ncbi:hypothetical protein BX666DRAFT_1855001 [Dichotomocladium elegans]|nr:hypothetical protein BX666DRAFT_1855001 [Dichotomocladium elegans]
MATYVARLVAEQYSERGQSKPSIAETDPELLAAIQAATASTTKAHWWKKQPGADIILSERDRHVLRKVKKQAKFLDHGCKCCCISIGLDGIIGLIPFLGDIICVLLALNLVREACKADLPRSTIVQMLTNVTMDFMQVRGGLGMTPIAGDVLDILFKCNSRNAAILEEYLFLRRRNELRYHAGYGGV